MQGNNHGDFGTPGTLLFIVRGEAPWQAHRPRWLQAARFTPRSTDWPPLPSAICYV